MDWILKGLEKNNNWHESIKKNKYEKIVKEGAITSDKFHPKMSKKEELFHT